MITLALTACDREDPDEPHREGTTVTVDGIGYTVFISRQLNPRIPPDKGYYRLRAPAAGMTHFGVFLQTCNEEGPPRRAVEGFAIEDNAGNAYRPIELPRHNPFAYNPRRLAHEECIPQTGSLADLGPTAGALLLFELPLAAMENRPLVLDIGLQMPAGEAERVELDL